MEIGFPCIDYLLLSYFSGFDLYLFYLFYYLIHNNISSVVVIHEILQENAMRIMTFNIIVFVLIIIFVIKHFGHSIILFRKSRQGQYAPRYNCK